MQLIKNPDASRGLEYRVARVIYAETRASSLAVVEALASMINNLSAASHRDIAELITDDSIFETLKPDNPGHSYLNVSANSHAFQMCLRVTQRMLRGNLPDCCNGATRFHRADLLPAWCTSLGYIHDGGVLLFYR